MTFHRIYTHKPTTNTSMNTPLFSNIVSHKNKNKKRGKSDNFRNFEFYL